MPIASNGDVELWYDTFDHASGNQPLLLLPPLGGQALNWDERFCERSAAAGFFVIRCDLRDAGLSTKLDNAPAPDIEAISQGDLSSVAYSLDDMANDVVQLLEAVDVAHAHVMGWSLGGMIAQRLAIRRPELIRSLVLLSSAPSYRYASSGRGDAQASLVDERRSSHDREIAINAWMESKRIQASPAYTFDEAGMRSRLEQMYDRSWYPVGRMRQLAAIVASGDWQEQLTSVNAPTLVVHGERDPLIDVSASEALAKAIPEAELIIIPEMGHDLPEPLWDQLISAVKHNASR